MAKDIKQLLRDARLAERTVILCLNQDLNSDLEAKERQLAEALQGPDMSSMNGAAFPELRGEIVAIKDKMLDSQIEFTFRALSRNAYAGLIRDNPPRVDDKVDESNGFNWDEVTEALIRRGLVEPLLDDEDWKTLLGDDYPGVISSVQYDLLATAAWKVNRRDVDIPFLPSSSLNGQTSVGV